MIHFINFRSIFPYDTDIRINGNILKFNKTLTYDLQEIVDKYSQDNGCLAYGWSHQLETMMWLETTRLSHPFRCSIEESFSDQVLIGLSRNDTHTSRGRNNAASPVWVCRHFYDMIPCMFLLTPHKGCRVDECVGVYYLVEDTQTHHNVVIDKVHLPRSHPQCPSVKQYLEDWQQIQIHVEDDGRITLTQPKGTTVYLETDNGILTRNRVREGESSHLIYASGPATIKAGYKYWRGKSEVVYG